MAMNQSGTLTLVRRYAIDHHQRDLKLRTYFESLVGEDGDGPEQSRLLSEELPQLVIVHERDMRAQNKRYLSKRGILQQATLEHVYAADEEHPAREERAQFLRRFSATDIRRNTTKAGHKLRRFLRTSASEEGPHAHQAWLNTVKMMREEPEVVVWWVERCANNSHSRSRRERARCLDVLCAADLKTARMAAQRVIINILTSLTEPQEMQEYALGSLSSVGLPSPTLIEELARASLRASKHQRQFSHALGTVCTLYISHIRSSSNSAAAASAAYSAASASSMSDSCCPH